MAKYVQKYKKEWEKEKEFKDWLKPILGDNTRAFCIYCKTNILAHRKNLLHHAVSKKHLKKIGDEKQLLNIPKLNNFATTEIDVSRKIVELKISAFVAEHCSFRTADHLNEIIKQLDKNSTILSKIKLHRTKCTALILNVLSPCFLEQLIEDIGLSHYSLIIDESTTVDTNKILCLMIRYYSESHRKIKTCFYCLIELESGTADHITSCLKKKIEGDKLKLEKLIGIGIDGANTMCGKHNSVSSKLTSIIPHLTTVKCLSHSLHLCAERSCDALPKNLDFMVKESHAWFSNSTQRRGEFVRIHRIIANSNPRKICKLAGTRWLARLDAIETILDQWDSLELHFNTFRCTERGDPGFKAETLYQMFHCIENKLYLTFLGFALKKVISLNKLFQSESAEPLKLLQDLNNLLYSTLQAIVVPQQLQKVGNKDICSFQFKFYLMPVNCINFGYNFNALSSKCNPDSLNVIKQRCRDFLIKLAEELQKRVPTNIKILEKVSLFAPENASKQFKEDISDIALFYSSVCRDVDETTREWNLLHRLELNECTSDAYWGKVKEDLDAGGFPRFNHIAMLALSLLSLPFSNSSVERAFSTVNIVKDKLRNRMSIKTAEAVLRVRYALAGTCTKFEPTPQMIKKFKSEEVYKSEFNGEVLDAISDVELLNA